MFLHNHKRGINVNGINRSAEPLRTKKKLAFRFKRKVVSVLVRAFMPLGRGLGKVVKLGSIFKRKLKCIKPLVFMNPSVCKKSGINKVLSQSEFIIMLIDFKEYKNSREGQIVSFKEFLDIRGYSPRIKSISLVQHGILGDKAAGPGKTPFIGNDLFSGVDFSGCEFVKCNLGQLKLNDSMFRNVLFSECNLKGSIFSGSTFEEVRFEESTLTGAQFNEAVLKRVNFDNSKVDENNFERTNLINTAFQDCNLSRSAFWMTTVGENVTIADNGGKHAKVDDTLFFGNANKITFLGVAPPNIEKPVVGLMWDPLHPGMTAAKVFKTLKKKGVIPVRIGYTPSWVNTEKLSDEVSKLLVSEGVAKENSLAKGVIRSSDEVKAKEVAKLKRESSLLSKQLDGIVFPGGANVEELFYNDSPKSSEELASQDLRRTIYEFSLLDRARASGVPVLGMCRALQLVNVFDGGTLRDVDGEFAKLQRYEVKAPIKKDRFPLDGTTSNVLLKTEESMLLDLDATYRLSSPIELSDEKCCALEDKLLSEGYNADFHYSSRSSIIISNPTFHMRSGKSVSEGQVKETFKNILSEFGVVFEFPSMTFEKEESVSHGILKGALGDELSSVSAHKQMVDIKAESELDFVIIDDSSGQNVPKAAESRYGVPQIFTQFHPEFKGGKSTVAACFVSWLMTENNHAIFDVFTDSASSRKAKKRQLAELGRGMPKLKTVIKEDCR